VFTVLKTIPRCDSRSASKLTWFLSLTMRLFLTKDCWVASIGLNHDSRQDGRCHARQEIYFIRSVADSVDEHQSRESRFLECRLKPRHGCG
jgi:hypothetical protein